MSSPLLATCRSIQHALRLWVATVSVVVCILHGPLSHPSRMVPCRIAVLCFLTVGLGVPRGCALFACGGSWFGTDGSQRAARVSQVLSIALYFCTMVAKSANFSMWQRLMALRIPSSAQLLQNADIASSSRQSFTLSLTRRIWPRSGGPFPETAATCSRERLCLGGWVELNSNPDPILGPESEDLPD